MALTLIVGCKKEPEVKDEPSVDVVGTWIYGTRDGDDDAEYISFTFNADKTASLRECKNRNTNDFSYEISYAVKGSTITISASKGREWKYTAELKDEKLVLTQVGDATWLEEFSDLKEITLDRYYIISFNSNGGSTVYDQRVKSGEKATTPTSPTKTDWYFAGWTTDAAGKNAYNFETAVTADLTLYANWKDHFEIGDIGPAGGYIFYDCDADNDSGNADKLKSSQCGWRYLVAAASDLTVTGSYVMTTFVFGKWDSTGEEDWAVIGTSADVGKGQANTTAIASKITSHVAAYRCSSLTDDNGYNDWFLPSENELVLMYNNLKAKETGGTWVAGGYWSSTEKNGEYAYAVDFSNGTQLEKERERAFNVRPVRAFK